MHSKYYRLAYTFSKLTRSISYPKNDSLFIESAVYSYLPDFEISICSYYINELEDGLKSSNKIIHMKDEIPEHIFSRVNKNLKFYTTK